MPGSIQIANLPGVTYFDPATNQNVTVYPLNPANPLAGDAVAENATGLLRRYLQWMVQEIGVDGFRLDAAKHMEHYALQQFDAAVYRSNPRLRLDGSVEHVFMYGEVVPGDGQPPGQSRPGFSLRLHPQGHQSGAAQHDWRQPRRAGFRPAASN